MSRSLRRSGPLPDHAAGGDRLRGVFSVASPTRSSTLASSAISKFGLGFITTSNWDPVHGQFGAAQFLYGTAVSSFGALLLATPLSIAIALFLTELAPRGTRTPDRDPGRAAGGDPERDPRAVGHPRPRPALQSTIEPALHSVLGWIPLFGGEYFAGWAVPGDGDPDDHDGAGSIVSFRTGPRTMIPHSPRITLGIPASSSTSVRSRVREARRRQLGQEQRDATEIGVASRSAPKSSPRCRR